MGARLEFSAALRVAESELIAHCISQDSTVRIVPVPYRATAPLPTQTREHIQGGDPDTPTPPVETPPSRRMDVRELVHDEDIAGAAMQDIPENVNHTPPKDVKAKNKT